MDLAALFTLAWPLMLKGTGYTLLFAIASMALGLPVAGLVTLIRVLNVRGLSRLAAVYVSAMRGTPLLVQIFLVYYGLPGVGI